MPKNTKDRPSPPSRVPEFLAGDIGGDLLGDVAEALDLTDVLAEALREQWEARALHNATERVAKGSQAARARRKRLSSLRQPAGAWAASSEDDDAPHPQD